MESYIETYTGKHYHFLAPDPDEICIEDIAFALANKCRFSGHTKFYSVAEHCVAVCEMLPPEYKLSGLLHDAAEAYLGDIPSPIKAILPDYKKLEKINEDVICDKFDVDIHDPKIKEADRKLLAIEARHLIPSGGEHWSMTQNLKLTKEEYRWYQPLCLTPDEARDMYLNMYHALTYNKNKMYVPV